MCGHGWSGTGRGTFWSRMMKTSQTNATQTATDAAKWSRKHQNVYGLQQYIFFLVFLVVDFVVALPLISFFATDFPGTPLDCCFEPFAFGPPSAGATRARESCFAMTAVARGSTPAVRFSPDCTFAPATKLIHGSLPLLIQHTSDTTIRNLHLQKIISRTVFLATVNLLLMASLFVASYSKQAVQQCSSAAVKQ